VYRAYYKYFLRNHFTTAVSLSGVAETWSRSTLQSFQDMWKYPLHVFSCMCALVRFWGGWGSCYLWMQLIVATLRWNGKISSSPPSETSFLAYRTARFCQHSSFFSFFFFPMFAEHYQRRYLFILVKSWDRKWRATVKHKVAVRTSSNLNIGQDERKPAHTRMWSPGREELWLLTLRWTCS